MLNIFGLNEYCLKLIFEYCSNDDLENILQVCTYFKMIVVKHVFFTRTRDVLFCGHQCSPDLRRRTLAPLSYQNRFYLAKNWRNGAFVQKIIPNKVCQSILCLEANYLYVSQSRCVRVHRRNLNNIICRHFCKLFTSDSDHAIVDFVKKNDVLFAGHKYNTCFLTENDVSVQFQIAESSERFMALDFLNDIYVTASNECVRVWRRTDVDDTITLNLVNQSFEGCKSLKISPSGDNIYAGAFLGHGIQKINLSTGHVQKMNFPTYGINDLKIKDENVVLTATDDGYLRIYDCRSDNMVQCWADETESSFISLQYDGLYGVLCALKKGPSVHLYDTRVPNKSIQLYVTNPDKCNYASPAFGIVCDSRYLFISTHRAIRVLDFKNDNSPKQKIDCCESPTCHQQ